jgi:cation diffusion facilitator CzcD-associated flavoprotein CzcO
VAAKTLIHAHPKDTFHVTVLEQSHRIGGLWPVSKVDDGLVNPDMYTNQSRHTVSFSDLAWPETAPSFPKAWQVGEYLERYIKTYPGYEIRTNCKVLKTELLEGKWSVHVEDRASAVPVPQLLEFDHMIIATGFFGKPKFPKILGGFQRPVWHSSRLRDVKDLLTNESKTSFQPGRRIVVAGGQMSGVEIAASIAFQLSTASHSVEESSIPNASEYFVTHVVQQPFWVMPFLFPGNPVVDVPTPDKEAQKVWFRKLLPRE